jgi:hypothetical protein
MANKTLKERLDEVELQLIDTPENEELLALKAELEAKLAQVELMQAGKKKTTKFMIADHESNNYILCDIIKLEKIRTGKKDASGTVIWDFKEDKVLKQTKILKEQLTIHEAQEINTLKRYKEVK